MKFLQIEKFIYSFYVINFLRDRAWFSASFIEYIILSCSEVDALLRQGIILKEQINNKTDHINEKWLTGKFKERELFNRALKLKIIDEEFATDLHDLYTKRNEIVHRFMINGIDYEFSKRIASEFEPRIEKIRKILYELEKEQIQKNIGMTRKHKPSQKENRSFLKRLNNYFQMKMGNTLENINRVRSHKWPDVEDIVEFSSRGGYFKKCEDCQHEKIHHCHFSKNNFEIGKCKIANCHCKNFIPR